MSTISYHLMLFLNHKVTVINFFVATDGKHNLWTSQMLFSLNTLVLRSKLLLSNYLIQLSIIGSIKISRHMNIMTYNKLPYFLITVIVLFYEISQHWVSKSYLSSWLVWCTLTFPIHDKWRVQCRARLQMPRQ